MSTIEVFKNILNDIDDLFLRVEVNEIKPEHTIINDLGIDSLTRVTIFYEIQDHYETERDEMDAAKWNTIQDILSYMESISE